MTADRIVKDGQVAVLYSPGFGAGWSTWAGKDHTKDLVFDPWIVDILLSDHSQEEKTQLVTTHCLIKYPTLYLGGIDDLAIKWVPQGSEFRITEYDGSETVEIKDSCNWITA